MAGAEVDDLLLNVEVLLPCPLDAVGGDVAGLDELCWPKDAEETGIELWVVVEEAVPDGEFFDRVVSGTIPVEKKTGVLLLIVVGTLPVPELDTRVLLLAVLRTLPVPKLLVIGVVLLAVVRILSVSVSELRMMGVLLFGVLTTVPLVIGLLCLGLVELTTDGVVALDDVESMPEDAGTVEVPTSELVVGDDVAVLFDVTIREELSAVASEIAVEPELDMLGEAEGVGEVSDTLGELIRVDLVTVPDEAGVLLLGVLAVPLEARVLLLGVVTTDPLDWCANGRAALRCRDAPIGNWSTALWECVHRAARCWTVTLGILDRLAGSWSIAFRGCND